MKLSVVGYPRIGTLRELKFASEAYFKHAIEQTELKQTANRLRKTHWKTQLEHGIEFIPSNDFSFYDYNTGYRSTSKYHSGPLPDGWV